MLYLMPSEQFSCYIIVRTNYCLDPMMITNSWFVAPYFVLEAIFNSESTTINKYKRVVVIDRMVVASSNPAHDDKYASDLQQVGAFSGYSSSRWSRGLEVYTDVSEIPLPSDGFYGFAVAVGRQRALHTENSGSSLQLWVSTFPRFVAIWFYILSETLI